MENFLNQKYWSERYENNETGWDVGAPSAPLKEYFDQLQDKNLKILIPGCGNAYEAEYLFNLGFKNVIVIDLSPIPLKNLKKRIPDFPETNLIEGDFFDHLGSYDLIIEQTMFCAIEPNLRLQYAEKAHYLLSNRGKLVGVLFNREFEGGPPFGGNRTEYLTYFSSFFKSVSIEPCYNSIKPRKGTELFIKCHK